LFLIETRGSGNEQHTSSDRELTELAKVGETINAAGYFERSCDVWKSRMMREYQVRFCERLGVKFPLPTRHAIENYPLWGADLAPALLSPERCGVYLMIILHFMNNTG